MTKRIIIFSLGLVFLLSSSLFAELHISQDLVGVFYNVEGNKERSFYPNHDIDYLYEGGIDFKNPFKDYELFGNIEYRATDDRLVDVQDFSIERMYFGLKGEALEFLTGDFYANFSEYSLGNALKGLKLVLGNEKSSRLTLLGGMDTSKWEDLWETRQDDSATRKYVWGGRLENNLFNNKLSLNFNYGGSLDDPAYISSTTSQLLVNVFSTDLKYVINDYFTFSSELAQSFTDEDKRLDELKTKSDRALKAVLDFNSSAYTLTTTYSRVGNHFYTTGGFSASDLETLNFDAMWFMPLRIKFTHYLHTDRDNLSDTKTTTTNQINPGGKFSLQLPYDISLDFGSDLRKRFSTDKSTNSKTYTHSLNLNKDFRIFYSTLGYSKTIVSDKVSPSSERETDTYSLGLDGNFNLKEVKLSWNFSEDINHDHYKEVNEADFSTTTGFGLKLDFPSSLSLNAKVSFSDNNYYQNDTDSNTNQYSFSLSRNLKDNLSFELSYDHKGYEYVDGDNDYAERILKWKLSYRF
ncbi:MAG: hypothetical protein NC900_03190 [Candidatus Omnitrophica bacterium]|nr:hypothetical protein [Candidatus Omnitrophota bacterium]